MGSEKTFQPGLQVRVVERQGERELRWGITEPTLQTYCLTLFFVAKILKFRERRVTGDERREPQRLGVVGVVADRAVAVDELGDLSCCVVGSRAVSGLAERRPVQGREQGLDLWWVRAQPAGQELDRHDRVRRRRV